MWTAFSLAGYGVGIPVFIVIGLLALHCTVRIEPHDRIFTITLLEFSSWLTRVRDGAAIDTMQLLLVRCKRVVLKENNKKHNIEHQGSSTTLLAIPTDRLHILSP